MKLVKESLDFERTGNVKKSLGLGYVAKIRNFFRDLDIPDEDYTVENKDIIFNTSLYLRNSGITELPDNLTVNGDLDLSGADIIKLPDNLIVNDNLYLNNTNITELPNTILISRLIIVFNKQTELIDFIINSKFKDKLRIW